MDKKQNFNTDVFEDDNFDPITYINEKFPDENSLQNIDQEIENLQNELSNVSSDLQTNIHQHAVQNSELKNEILQANKITKEIVQEINTIKEKAEKSENLVYEMCKDIKQLDIAKKNLTFSITALKKFIMMMTAVDKLRDCCEQKTYQEVANLIQAFDELSQYFKRYQNIPQILDLLKEKDAIIKELKEQLREDFEAFDRQATNLNLQDMSSACKVVETIGTNFKNEIVGKLCGLVLDSYNKTFSQPENNNLEVYERRFKWLQRNLKEFENRWQGVFPEYWAISNFIVYEFCGLTRIALTQILEREHEQKDVKELMTAFQLTLSFEQGITKDMEKRYHQYVQLSQIYMIEDEEKKQEEMGKIDPQILQLKEQKGHLMVQRLPKFKGSISDSFEPYLAPYINKEERDLFDYIRNTINQQQNEDRISDLNIFNSSLYMFNYIKSLIKRASQYSRNQLMASIAGVIKRGLQLYSEELSQMIQKLERQKNINGKKLSQECAYVINTAEYCKDNMQALEEALVDSLDAPFSDQVDMYTEEEQFIQNINSVIEILLQNIGKMLEPKFSEILKQVNFGNTEDIEITQEHVNIIMYIKNELTNHIREIKPLVSEIYFNFYLNKLVVLVNSKFIQMIYKFQKFESGAFPQMMADTADLEQCLKNLAKLDSDKKTTSFDSFVTKTFEKSKKLIKLLVLSPDQFLNEFTSYIEEINVQDVEKLIKIKGIKKQDAHELFRIAKK